MAGFFLIFSGHIGLKGQKAAVDAKAPYEIRFADVTFQLSDVARYLLSQDMAYLDKNPQIRQDYLNSLSVYLPVIDPIMSRLEVSEDFKFLSIYPRFQKSIGLVTVLEPGVFWCFDKTKATEAGLRINAEVDETKHLIKATEGALAGLKKNQALYNSWATALFAQLADKSVLRALDVPKKWNGNRFVVIDSPAYSSLIQFLAYKLVMDREWPGFRPEEHQIVYQYPYGKDKSLNLIGADLHVEPQSLVENNKWLKVNKVPANSEVIVVVAASRYHEIRKLGELSRNLGIAGYETGFPLLKDAPELHKGKGGSFHLINGKKGIRADYCDSHVTLAYKSALSLKKFLEYNEMTEREVTSVGQVFYLEEKDGKSPIPFHIVKEGETLWYIAQMYGIKVPDLLNYNRMDAVQRLQQGRVLWLQRKRSKKRPVEFVELPKEEITVLEDTPLAVTEEASELPAVKLPAELPQIPELKKEIVREEEIIVLREPEKPVKQLAPPVREVKTETKPTVEPPVRKDEKKQVAIAEKSNEAYPEGTELKDGYVYHVVKKGETLYRVSVNYKVSVEKLYQLNNLKSNTIEIGDWIKVRPI